VTNSRLARLPLESQLVLLPLISSPGVSFVAPGFMMARSLQFRRFQCSPGSRC
jgi:hypothetical protein